MVEMFSQDLRPEAEIKIRSSQEWKGHLGISNLLPAGVPSHESISNVTWASQGLQWTIWLRAVRRGSDPTGLLGGPSTLTLKRSASHVPGTVRVHQNAQPVSVSGSRQTWWHPQTQES